MSSSKQQVVCPPATMLSWSDLIKEHRDSSLVAGDYISLYYLEEFFLSQVLVLEKQMKYWEDEYCSYKQIPEYIELRGRLSVYKELAEGLV